MNFLRNKVREMGTGTDEDPNSIDNEKDQLPTRDEDEFEDAMEPLKNDAAPEPEPSKKASTVLPEDDDIRDSQHDDDEIISASSNDVIDSGDEMEVDDIVDVSEPDEGDDDRVLLETIKRKNLSTPFFDAISDDIPSKEDPPEATPSESQLRKQRINEEVQVLLDTTKREELEDGDSIDHEMAQALLAAAHKICYRKKYYDVTKDAFQTFPSVAKTVVNSTLLDAAQEFCTSEEYREDGFPPLYTAALRATASELAEKEGDDNDGSLRDRLASTVHSKSISKRSAATSESQRSSVLSSICDTSGSASDKDDDPSSRHENVNSSTLEPSAPLLGTTEASEKEEEETLDDDLLFVHRTASGSNAPAPNTVETKEQAESLNKTKELNSNDYQPEEYLEITVHSATKNSEPNQEPDPDEFEEVTYHSKGVFVYTKNEEIVDEDITFHSSSGRGVVAVDDDTKEKDETFEDAQNLGHETDIVPSVGSENIVNDVSQETGTDPPTDNGLKKVFGTDIETLKSLSRPDDDATEGQELPEDESSTSNLIETTTKGEEGDAVFEAARAAAEEAKALQQEQSKQQRGSGFMGGIFKGFLGSNSNIPSNDSSIAANGLSVDGLKREEITSISKGAQPPSMLFPELSKGVIEESIAAGSTKSAEGYSDTRSDTSQPPRGSSHCSENPTDGSLSVKSIDPQQGDTSHLNPYPELKEEVNFKDSLQELKNVLMPASSSSQTRPSATSAASGDTYSDTRPDASQPPRGSSHYSENPTAGSLSVKSIDPQQEDTSHLNPYPELKEEENFKDSLQELKNVLMPASSLSQTRPSATSAAINSTWQGTEPAFDGEIFDNRMELERLEALLQVPPSPIRPTVETKETKGKSPEIQRLEEILLSTPPGSLSKNMDGRKLSEDCGWLPPPTKSQERSASFLDSLENEKEDSAKILNNELKNGMERLGKDIEDIKGEKEAVSPRTATAAEPVVTNRVSQHPKSPDQASNGNISMDSLDTSEEEISEAYDSLLADATSQLENLRSEMKELQEMSQAVRNEDVGQGHQMENDTGKQSRLREPPAGGDDVHDVENRGTDKKPSKIRRKRSKRKKTKGKKQQAKSEEKEETERRSNRSIEIDDRFDPEEGGHLITILDPDGDIDMTKAETHPHQSSSTLKVKKLSERPSIFSDPPAFNNGESKARTEQNGRDDPDGEKQDAIDLQGKSIRRGKLRSPGGEEPDLTLPEIEEEVDYVDYEVKLQGDDERVNFPHGMDEQEEFSRDSTEEDFISRDPSVGYDDYVSRDPSVGTAESYPMDRGYSSGEEDRNYVKERGRQDRKSNQSSANDEWEDVPCSFCCRYLPHNWVVATSYVYGLNGNNKKDEKKVER